MKTEGRTKKLPKWAQEEIGYLEMRLKEAKQTIVEQANPGLTRIAVNESLYKDGGADYWANDGDKITFWLPDNEKGIASSNYITFYLNGKELHVNASQPLTIRPQSSNVVDLSLER